MAELTWINSSVCPFVFGSLPLRCSREFCHASMWAYSSNTVVFDRPVVWPPNDDSVSLTMTQEKNIFWSRENNFTHRCLHLTIIGLNRLECQVTANMKEMARIPEPFLKAWLQTRQYVEVSHHGKLESTLTTHPIPFWTYTAGLAELEKLGYLYETDGSGCPEFGGSGSGWFGE